MDEMGGEGAGVRHVTSIPSLAKGVVFSLYEAASAAAVSQLNERQGIPSAASQMRSPLQA
jgi:hypothetical protein